MESLINYFTTFLNISITFEQNNYGTEKFVVTRLSRTIDVSDFHST